MHVTTNLLFVGLALGAYVEKYSLTEREPPSLIQRDIIAVTSVVGAVDTGIKSFDAAVKGFSGDAAGLASAASSLIDTITSGTATIAATSELALQDALGLTAIVTNLQTDGTALVKSLETQKGAFEKPGCVTRSVNISLASQPGPSCSSTPLSPKSQRQPKPLPPRSLPV